MEVRNVSREVSDELWEVENDAVSKDIHYT